MGLATSARRLSFGAAAAVAAMLPFNAEAQSRAVPANARSSAMVSRTVSNDTRMPNTFKEVDKRDIELSGAVEYAKRNASKGYAILLIGNDEEVIQMSRQILTDVAQTGRTRLALVITNGTPRGGAIYTNNSVVLFEAKNNSQAIRANDRSYTQIRAALVRAYDQDIGPLIAASRQNEAPQPQN